MDLRNIILGFRVLLRQQMSVTCDPDVAVGWAAGGSPYIVAVPIQPLALLTTHQVPVANLPKKHSTVLQHGLSYWRCELVQNI